MKIPEKVKQLFKMDSVKKNLRVHFPNGDRGDLTNAQIPEENFQFTENLCSQSELKFGLCEANVVEFECVGIENIEDYEIEVSHEIDISSLGEEFIAEYGMISDDVPFPYYRIPYGSFVVSTCPRQTDMRERKVTAYTKEVKWNDVPNPVERAKTNENLSCKYNTPYKFNVAAFVFANTSDGDVESLSEKVNVAQSDYSGTSYASLYKYESKAIRCESSVKYNYHKYAFTILSKNRVLFELPIDGNIDDLYLLEQPDAEHIEEINQLIKEIISNEEYCLNPLDISEILTINNEIKFGSYEPPTYEPFFDEYSVGQVVLDEHKYLYPFMNYSTKEKTEITNSNYGKICVRIPSNVILRVEDVFYDDLMEPYVDKTILFETSFEIKNAEDIKCYKINSLPSIYCSINRTADTNSHGKKYILSKTDIDTKAIIESYAEFNGMFGKYNRDGKFEFMKVNTNFGLYPSEDLYPEEDLYPNDPSGGVLARSHYIHARYNDKYTKPYDRVSVTYTNTDGEKIHAYYQIIDEETEGYIADNYQTYSLAYNYLINNCTFTAEQIEKILTTLAEIIKDIQYMPADIDLIGLPWVEAGDVVNVITYDAGIETIVLRRTLSGVQTIKDNFESKG